MPRSSSRLAAKPRRDYKVMSTGKARRKTAAPKTKKATVALIKSVVAREEETKFVSQTQQFRVTHNSGITNGDIIPALPKLIQDEGEGAAWQRMGMKVSPRSTYVDCYVSLADVERSGAIEVFWFLLSHKTQKNIPQLNTTGGVDMTEFLRTGEGSRTVGFVGTTDTCTLPVNNAMFNVLKRGTFKLGKNTGQVQDSITAGNQPLYTAISKRWRIKLNAPKKLTYHQDPSGPGARTIEYPNGYAPFLVFGYVHQNQTTPDTLNQDISVTIRNSMFYDDA